MAGQRTVNIPDIKKIIEEDSRNLSVKAYSGVLLLMDEISDQDPETGLVVSLDGGLTNFKTSNSNICSGVIVSVAEEYLTQYTGDYTPQIGDRIITNINKSIPLTLADKDGKTYYLINVREEDLLAKIETDTNLKV